MTHKENYIEDMLVSQNGFEQLIKERPRLPELSRIQLFLDSVIFSEIEKYAWLIKGITTTPTFFKSDNVDYDKFITELRSEYPNLELHIEALGPTIKETEEEIKKILKQPWYDQEK